MKRSDLKIAFVSDHTGNAIQGAQIAHALVKEGVDVEYVLNCRGSAWDAIGNNRIPDFKGLPKVSAIEPGKSVFNPEAFTELNALVTTLSVGSDDKPLLEQIAVEAALKAGVPVYGLEDMVGGRFNRGWDSLFPQFERLFSTIKMPDDSSYRVTVIGPTQVVKYKDVDIPAAAARVRKTLRIEADERVIVFLGHPNPESPLALFQLGEALLKTPRVREKLVLIIARHGRDIVSLIEGNQHLYAQTLPYLRDVLTIRVIDNSPDYATLSDDLFPFVMRPEFRPKTVVPYQDLVALCSSNGLMVTGFATDGVIVAPHLGIPSILFLHPMTLGWLLRKEKKIERLPIPAVVPQVSTVDQLTYHLERLFLDPHVRERHCEELCRQFPFLPDPPRVAVDTIFQDFGISA